MASKLKLLGNRIRVAREYAGFTQREIAERIGLSHVAYGAIERGQSNPQIDYLFQLQAILGRSVAYFLGLDTSLTEDEDQLLTLYRSLDDPELKALMIESCQLTKKNLEKAYGRRRP